MQAFFVRAPRSNRRDPDNEPPPEITLICLDDKPICACWSPVSVPRVLNSIATRHKIPVERLTTQVVAIVDSK